MKHLTQILDGKRISYTDQTVFLVQVGHGPKGSYKTRYSFRGSLPNAVFYYCAINIGRGFKKRLFMTGSVKRPVLAKATS